MTFSLYPKSGHCCMSLNGQSIHNSTNGFSLLCGRHIEKKNIRAHTHYGFRRGQFFCAVNEILPFHYFEATMYWELVRKILIEFEQNFPKINQARKCCANLVWNSSSDRSQYQAWDEQKMMIKFIRQFNYKAIYKWPAKREKGDNAGRKLIKSLLCGGE